MMKILNANELDAFIQKATLVHFDVEHDDGNVWETHIYALNDKLYRIGYCNDCPLNARNEIELDEVEKVVEVKTITEVSYVPVDKT